MMIEHCVAAAVNDGLPPDKAGALPIMENLYYGDNVGLRDPLVSPMFADAVLCQFAPTLFLTATHAAELSNEFCTHARLVDPGRESGLHVIGPAGACVPSDRHTAGKPAGTARCRTFF